MAHLKTHVDSGRLSLPPIYLSTLSRLDALDCKVARGDQVRAQQDGRKRVSPPLHIFCASKRNGLHIVISQRSRRVMGLW